uniref:Uncharacterized protein n=1 Tax=viral metagenome TaxID=1070528 RepID=A0A6H1Z7K7_9ZZZZ
MVAEKEKKEKPNGGDKKWQALENVLAKYLKCDFRAEFQKEVEKLTK